MAQARALTTTAPQANPLKAAGLSNAGELAVRISEVTARFTLDALPGKQMSIDADLNGGLIDETEARRRRKELTSEAEFYGAMDGASRFTQRDAVASILITGVNIIAGFLIGVLQHGMDFRRAI